MRLLAALATMTAFTFLVTACGGSSQPQTDGVASTPSISFTSVGNNDDAYSWHVANVTMPNGLVLTCIKVDSRNDAPVSVSCNWQLFNKESGR